MNPGDSMIRNGLIPTARAVIDINRPCNARCRMCYYTYNESNWSKPIETVREELLSAKKRGNSSVDFTGGEPTIYPKMAEVIRYAESAGLHTCIITNGLALEKIKKLVEAGCREWLVSIHGFEDGHDRLLDVPEAWKKVNKTIEFLNQSGCFVRVNCTITRHNILDLAKLALHFTNYVKPKIVNFINFNPHYEWGNQKQPEVYERLNEVQAKVSEAAPYLRQALDLLNSKNIWTNVRYFPFCVLKSYESNICNNPQVMFDPYEWDYGVTPKSTDAYLAHGRNFQENIGSKDGACGHCGILNVCGGAHKNYVKLHGDSELEPYTDQSDYPYHFRRDLEADIVIPVFEPNEKMQQLLKEIACKTVPPYNLILTTHHQSAAKNRNYGLERSKSPYVIMCDDDIDDLPFGWNRSLVYAIKENNDFLAVSARLMDRDGKPGKNTANNFDLSSPKPQVEMIPTACCVFRNTDVRFDERFLRAGWEDTDFFVQLQNRYGGKLAIDNTVRVVHLNEEKNGGGATNFHNQNLFFEKWPEKKKHLQGGGSSLRYSALEPDIEALIRQCDFQSAASALQSKITHCGDDPALYNNLALALWQSDRRERALLCFHQAATLNPSDRGIVLNFIHASYELQKYSLMEAFLKTMVGMYPQSNEFSSLLTDCVSRQDRAVKVINDRHQGCQASDIHT